MGIALVIMGLTMPLRADAVPAGMVQVSDGRSVRLADVVFPDPGVQGNQIDSARFDRAAEGFLNSASEITVAVRGVDRYRREIATVDAAGGKSLARAVVLEGLAYAQPIHMDDDAAIALLDAEKAARSGRKGLWAVPSLAVQDVANLLADPPRFVVVEGDVRRLTKRGGTFYLDFGDDWRKDFTARIQATSARRIVKRGIDLTSLEGSRVRVRGWVFWWFGPMIEIEQEHALEIVPRS